MMKKKINYIIMIILVLAACTPEDFKPLGEPTDWSEGIAGTWTCETFYQMEMDAINKSFPEFAAKKDLTNVFPGHPYTDFSISLNADGTFTSTQGTSYMDMLSTGTWTLDNAEFPSAVILDDGTDSQTVVIGSFAGIVYGEFQLAIERKDATSGKTIITYELNLKKN